MTYALYQLKRTTNLKTAINAYYGYAHSRLSYGVVLWGNSVDAQQLFTIQKKCVRILVNITQTETCRSHFVNLNILTLTSIYILEMCKFVKRYRHLYNQAKDFHDISRNLRHRDRLIAPFTNLSLVSSNSYHRSIKIFNKPPLI